METIAIYLALCVAIAGLCFWILKNRDDYD